MEMEDKSLALCLLEKFQEDRCKIERYSAIAERCPLPAFVTGSDGTSILYINPAYVTMTGRTLDELQGGKWDIVIHPDDRAEAVETWKKFTLNNTRTYHRHRYIHKNGSIMEGITVVDRVENNGFVGFVLPHCGSLTCPMRALHSVPWDLWPALVATPSVQT